ncbi:intraflagellar transport protein 74 homolog [Uranotaenia lowii]|uniref:intraflagellar transport protein 74 homolog n=1 Tax=Uranotaenia lowii TaxID=190385 RepID=UPI00247935AB|nr:intraflagellar transport protein 74 homolog [Uranotaenia lowii]XP_055591663.1 intraflagellar transport protein 74 homolog [Uranotaenia lowii]
MEDFNNISSSRSSSERPQSRRGGGMGTGSVFNTFNDSASPSPIGILRPGTAVKAPSAIRGGTASRLVANNVLSTNSSASAQRIGTALGNAGNRMTDRPITQHGISGLSTSYGRVTTASGNRQIKDKRYWQAVLQSKIQEISNETDKILKEKKFLDREKSARKLYEKKVKEAAKELTQLQSTLTSMNIALDNCSSGMTRQQLHNETVVLRERNEHIQEQLEIVFKQRQIKDVENRELEVQVDKEKNKINDMIYSLPENEQQKYREYQALSESLRQQNTIYHNQISDLEKQKERLNTVIMNSQSRTEAHRLKSKLKELIAKRNQMLDEENNRLSPAQEREKLINEVRSNNQALASIGKQLKIIEDQLNEKKELMQQIDQDLEEGNSERHIKYKELKKRDEVMSSFMDTFQQSLAIEKQNVEALKNQITYAIEQITLQGINMKSLGSDKLDSSGFTAKNDLNSHAGLMKEYKKLSIQLKQLQILEKRTISQLNGLRQEENDALNNIQKFSNLEAPRSEATIKMSDLSGTLQELEDKKRVTENVVDEAQKRNQEIKINLKSNETYRQISHLEDKLIDLMKENKNLQEVVEQLQKECDYSISQKEVKELLNEHNNLLCSETNNNVVNRLL